MLNKIERTTMTTRVVDNLIDFIWRSKLRPGDALPSSEKLQDSLGVSRPVIREALKILEGRNIVETVNGKGTVVRDADQAALADFFQHVVQIRPKSVLELMEVRRGIEMQSAALAATRRTEAQLLTIQQTVRDMHTAADDVARYADLDVALHLQIAQAAHNHMLFYLVDSIRGALKRSMIEGMSKRRTKSAVLKVHQLHQALVDAIASGDAEAAQLAMSRHFEDAIAALSKSLPEEVAEAPTILS